MKDKEEEEEEEMRVEGRLAVSRYDSGRRKDVCSNEVEEEEEEEDIIRIASVEMEELRVEREEGIENEMG